jgi:hypothetical protein
MTSRPADTDPAAQQEYERRLRALSPEQRIRAISDLSEELRELMIAGVLSRHPDYTPEQARQAVVRRLLGDELFRAAYPDAGLFEI